MTLLPQRKLTSRQTSALPKLWPTFVLRVVTGRKAVARDHVGLPVKDWTDQFLRLVGRIGVVGVRHDVDIGVDLPENRPDDVSLALPVDLDHDGARRFCQFGRTVGAGIVEDVDVRVGQCGPEIRNRFGDRLCLVVAGQADRNTFVVQCSVTFSESKKMPGRILAPFVSNTIYANTG